MTKPTSCLALFVVAVSLHGPSSLEACWKGFTTNGSNPGLNTMLLCIAANDAIDLRVYFPNTAIREPPTTCMSRGRRSDSQGNTFRVVTQVGRCENGNSMGRYDLQCTVAAEDTMSCTYLVPSGNSIQLVLTRVFP